MRGEEVFVFCNCAVSYKRISEKFNGEEKLHTLFEGSNVGLSKAYNSLIELIDENRASRFYLFDQDTEISDYFFTVKDSLTKYIDVDKYFFFTSNNIL